MHAWSLCLNAAAADPCQDRNALVRFFTDNVGLLIRLPMGLASTKEGMESTQFGSRETFDPNAHAGRLAWIGQGGIQDSK